MHDHDIAAIAGHFNIPGQFAEAGPCGSGHINDTFAAVCNEGQAKKRYAIQRINHNIFKDPPDLMDNVVRVTDHIRSKLETQNADDISRRVLTVIPTSEGANYFKDEDGNYWRAYHFIEDARTYDIAESLEQIYQAAKAFGDFQNLLADLPDPALHETIADFHNGPKRFADFMAALEEDTQNRAKDAKQEIDFLKEHGSIFDVLPRLTLQGEIPIRVTHNDTKINNVMFDDKTGEGICVIDLDTVMPGLALYDFGDLVRTTISDAAEDEQDLSKVTIDLARFEPIVRGYLSSAGDFLNKTECQHLVHGGLMITLIMGTRFLTDYLAGDVYYKTRRPSHNLDRCRTQFKLAKLMIGQRDQMEAIVSRLSP